MDELDLEILEVFKQLDIENKLSALTLAASFFEELGGGAA